MNERANLPTIAQGSNRGTLFAMDESDSILSASEIIKGGCSITLSKRLKSQCV